MAHKESSLRIERSTLQILLLTLIYGADTAIHTVDEQAQSRT